MRNEAVRWAGVGSLVVAGAIYTLCGILARTLGELLADSTQIVLRYSLAFFLVALLVAARRLRFFLPRDALLPATALGLAFGLTVLFYTIAVGATTLANSVFLLYAGSLCAAFTYSVFLLREAVTRLQVFAFALTVVGLMFFMPSLFALGAGVAAAFAAGIFDGISNGLRRRLKNVDPWSLILHQYGVGAAFAVVSALVFDQAPIAWVAPGTAFLILVYALLLIMLGYALFYGFSRLPVGVGSIILCVEILFSVLAGFLLYREVPLPQEFAGGVLILAAAIIVALKG